MLSHSCWDWSLSWSLDYVDYSIVILNQKYSENTQLIVQVKIQRWHFKSCQLSLTCWPTWSVGFDRPFTQSTRKSLSFLWASLRAPSAAEREGDIFGCADLFGYQSVNPLSFRHHYLTVMWWNFFIPKGVRHAYYILKSSFSLLPQYFLWRCRRQIKPHFKNLAIGERSVKALVPLLACTSESFYRWFLDQFILRNSDIRRKGRTPRRTSNCHKSSYAISERHLWTIKENDARWQQN